MTSKPKIYDRELLLGPKRNQVLELEEVEQYGQDTFGDRDHVSVFSMRPREWHARGVRLLGRTVVECTRDALADAIATDISAVCTESLSRTDIRVIDPFAGSGNSLYWIVRRLPGAVGFGVELDPGICALARANLTLVGSHLEILNCDYRSALDRLAFPERPTVIAFISPPWGTALSKRTGLNLSRTMPPVSEVVTSFIQRFLHNPLLCAIQILENPEPASMADIAAGFQWTSVSLYDLSRTYDRRPGLLLGTRNWRH